MKYQIRLGHETNSSSMHSLMMTRKNEGMRMTQKEIRDEYWLDTDWHKDNVLHIHSYDNSYGRSFDVLSTFSDKLNYALAEYCGNNYSLKSYLEAEDKFYEMFYPLLLKLVGVDDVTYDSNLERFYVYSDVPNEYMDEAEEVPYENRVYNEKHREDRNEPYYMPNDINGRPIEDAYYRVPDFGDIDHASNGILRKFLKENNLTLEDYLVRKDIITVIDSDESCIFKSLINCGLIDENNIITLQQGGDL